MQEIIAMVGTDGAIKLLTLKMYVERRYNMNYYKIIHKETGTLMCYATSEPGDNVDDICEILGRNEHIAVAITKEEYE